MRTRRLVPIVGLGLVVAAATWRTVRRARQLPYPFWMAVTPVTDWLYGTRTILAHLDLRPGQRVLEVGPGLGRLLLPAANLVLPGGEVTGVEIDPGIARALRERIAGAGVTNATVIDGDIATQHLPAAHFDVAYLAAVLGEIGERAAAVRAIHDALQPGGRLVIIEGWPDPHHQTLDAVDQLLTPLGFRRESVSRAWGRYTAVFTKT
jgi:protein-L-isoaspartate O-methyltransferase